MLELGLELTALTKGLRCTEVELYAERSWTFGFEGQLRLNVGCPWRIVNDAGIALGREDDGQKFGLPEPVNGAARALALLSATNLKEVVITEPTGDLSLVLDSGVRLEVFNNSSGYEGWNCWSSSGLEVIGMGGGGTAHFVY